MGAGTWTSDQVCHNTRQNRCGISKLLLQRLWSNHGDRSHRFGVLPSHPSAAAPILLSAADVPDHEVSVAGPLAMESWARALEELHIHHGCVVPDTQPKSVPDQVWRNLAVAMRQWRRMDATTQDVSRLGVQPISPGAVRDTVLANSMSAMGLSQQQPDEHAAHEAARSDQRQLLETQLGDDQSGASQPQSAGLPQVSRGDTMIGELAQRTIGEENHVSGALTALCPACWRECTVASADACLGLTQLRSAGTASDFLQPSLPHSPFIPDDKVKERLAIRKSLDTSALDRPGSSEFTAASLTASDQDKRLYVQVKLLLFLCICLRQTLVFSALLD